MCAYRIANHVCAGRFFACALLTISLFLLSPTGYGEELVGYALTMRVQLKDPLPVSVRDLPEFVRVVSIRDEKGDAVKLDRRVTITKGYTLDIKVREGVDFFGFAKPVLATLYAPLYLGKQVEVRGVSGVDMAGKKATIPIRQDGLGVAVEANGKIAILDHDRENLGNVVLMTFQREVLARAPRVIGMKPVRKQSFQLMDPWVSGGEEVRVKVPIPDIDEKNSSLVVGFWTDHPDSAMELDAYLADITSIEPDKAGGSNYIVKARMPYLSELNHVVPGWYCPYPPTVKMTVTTQPDENQIVSETFDLHVTRRGWGVTAGLLFLFIVLLAIMYITRCHNPFEEGTERHKKWEDTHKSIWIKRFFFAPLDIAITPFGTYSISVAQALFWTFIVAFSCIYVYMLKAAFITIPAQILTLLGIGGGTALASRINATTRDVVPKEIMKEINKTRKEIPRLRDMISIGGQLNIYKFQMMVFTLITGGIVVAELIKACNFPEIPSTLIMLMGLSNTLYLGSEITIEPVEGLRKKLKDYREARDDKEREKLGNEIKSLLTEY